MPLACERWAFYARGTIFSICSRGMEPIATSITLQQSGGEEVRLSAELDNGPSWMRDGGCYWLGVVLMALR